MKTLLVFSALIITTFILYQGNIIAATWQQTGSSYRACGMGAGSGAGVPRGSNCSAVGSTSSCFNVAGGCFYIGNCTCTF